MSVRCSGFGVSYALGLTLLLHGCAVSAISQEDDDANLSLTGDPDIWRDAGEGAGAVTGSDGGAPVPETQLPDGTPDGNTPRGDAGSVPNSPDAGIEPAGQTLPLTMDGIVRDAEWASATWTTQNTPSNWGTNRNVLLSLAVTIRDGALWIAVRGAIESTNALVVYFDSTPNAGLAPSAITDQTGELDDALSATLTTPASFNAEIAWGTRSMGVSATSGFNAGMGFRSLVDTNASNLSWIDAGEAPTVCSMNACEARIPLTYLGAGNSVSLFARIASANGNTFSNQTLPADAPDSPQNVTQLLTIAR